MLGSLPRDDIIKSASFSYTTGGKNTPRLEPNGRAMDSEMCESNFAYMIIYSQLGSAPAVEPSDAAHTITTDRPEGYAPK